MNNEKTNNGSAQQSFERQRQEAFVRHLALCVEIYEKQKRNGTWPWADDEFEADSPKSEDMVDSNHNPLSA